MHYYVTVLTRFYVLGLRRKRRALRQTRIDWVHLPLRNRLRVFLRALGKPEAGFAAQFWYGQVSEIQNHNDDT